MFFNLNTTLLIFGIFFIGFFLILYEYRAALEWTLLIACILFFCVLSFFKTVDAFSHCGFFSIVAFKPLAFETIFNKPFFIFYCFGVDGLSIWFVFLVSLIFFCCYYYFCDLSKTDYHTPDLFILLIFILQFFLFCCFSSLDVLVFFFFFESLLLPLYYIILFWGSSGSKKYRAATYFVVYTVLFSSPLLFSVFYVTSKTGVQGVNFIDSFLSLNFSDSGAFVACGCAILAFCAKAPIFPLHVWLPEAHVEAPTIGSVILASLVLKLGAYGLLRFTLPFFKSLCFFFAPFVLVLSSFGCFYAALLATRQLDLKKVIAYSSVVHMNFALVGFFSGTISGLMGGFITLIAHGLISSCLFFLVGMLYRRLKTRRISSISGLVGVMPLCSFFLFVSFLANLGFPLSLNFVGELFIFIGLWASSYFSVVILAFCSLGFILNVVYNIWTFSRLVFGESGLGLKGCLVADLSLREFTLLASLIFPVIFLGVCPGSVISCFEGYRQSLWV